MKSLHKYVLMTIVLVASASSAQAQEIYGAGFLQAFNKGDTSVRKEVPSALYSIDTNTGATTFIGEIGFLDCTGLDYDHLTKQLFAVCFDGNLSDAVLVNVNPNTGEGELIGPLNLDEGLFIVEDISFRSDGVLFAIASGKLINQTGIIDTQTGNFTPLGGTGLGDFNEGGLAFSLQDILFYAGFGLIESNGLFVVNQQSGIANFDKPVVFADRSQDHAIQSLDTNLRDGRIFAVYSEFQDDSAILGTLDPDTGLIRDIGPTSGIFIRAIASKSSSINIPTLSEYGLIATAIVLLGVATICLRRRRSSATA